MRIVYPPTISFNLLKQRPQFILEYAGRLGHKPVFFDSNPPYEGAEHCTKPYYSNQVKVVPPTYNPVKLQPFNLYYSISDHCSWFNYDPDLVIYDFLDFPVGNQSWSALELSLENADYVLAVSDYLMEIAKDLGKDTATYIPNGVEIEKFEGPFESLKNLSCIRALSRSSIKMLEAADDIIGYTGVIWSEVWDHELFLDVCYEFKDDVILVTGAFFDDYGELPENVIFLGHVDRDGLPSLMGNLDVAIIPFLQNDFTKAMCPLKYLEYCAAGIPVVSTPIPEVEKGPADIGQTNSEFIELIHKNKENGNNPIDFKIRREHAKQNSWDKVLKPLDKMLEG